MHETPNKVPNRHLENTSSSMIKKHNLTSIAYQIHQLHKWLENVDIDKVVLDDFWKTTCYYMYIEHMRSKNLNNSLHRPCIKSTLTWLGNLPIQDMPCLHLTRRRHKATCVVAMQTTTQPCAYNKKHSKVVWEIQKIPCIKQSIISLHTYECKNL